MSYSPTEYTLAIRELLRAFRLATHVSQKDAEAAMQRHVITADIEESKKFIETFSQKMLQRDPHLTALKKTVNSVLCENPSNTFIVEFIIRCRQTRLCYSLAKRKEFPTSDVYSHSSSPYEPEPRISPFSRRSASRGRIYAVDTNSTPDLDVGRLRSNSSMNYEGRERDRSRRNSPFRTVTQTHTPASSIRTPSTSASNRLFNHIQNSSDAPSAATPTTASRTVSSISAVTNSYQKVPIHARMGQPICETEECVCNALLAALKGIETTSIRLSGSRKLIVSTTAAFQTFHVPIVDSVLQVANMYLRLSSKDVALGKDPLVNALLASINSICGEYLSEVDQLRNGKAVTFAKLLPVVESWRVRMVALNALFGIRTIDSLDLLDALFVFHSSWSYTKKRAELMNRVMEYTMGVFCKQLIEWLTTAELPKSPWVIRRDGDVAAIRRVPIFMSPDDLRLALEIGNSLRYVDSDLVGDDDIVSIERINTKIKDKLDVKCLLEADENGKLHGLLKEMRSVVCGVVIRTLRSKGKLREHLEMAKSFLLLSDIRFSLALFESIKRMSMGIQLGTNISKQEASRALANALSCTPYEQKKLGFRLDSLSSVGDTPNVSSRMQFIQPLRPRYYPNIPILEPVFSACHELYEDAFHMVWSLDLARISAQQATEEILPIARLFRHDFKTREATSSVLNMVSSTFYVINTNLHKIRQHISFHVEKSFAELLAHVDAAVDLDGVVQAHVRFLEAVRTQLFLADDDKIAPTLHIFLKLALEAQEALNVFVEPWRKALDNGEKVKNVELGRGSTNMRLLMEKINKVVKTLNSDLMIRELRR